MTDWPVVMTIVCNNAAHEEPQEVWKMQITSAEPKGVLLRGARVVVDDERVEPEPGEVTARTFFRTARSSGRLPRVVLELRCPAPNCTVTARVPDLGLRRALGRLAEHGETSAELKVIERIVKASS